MFLCSQISTADFTEIIPEGGQISIPDAFAKYFEIHKVEDSLGLLQSQYVMSMYDKIKDTVRFKNVYLRRQVNLYDKENEEQFSVVTIVLPDNTICISFRGTDDTIIGWKEDCNLSVYETVPAQKDAIDYVNAEAKFDTVSGIRICGHSKGGNLAVTAGVRVAPDVRKRIIQVYSFDGPGFQPSFLRKKGYLEMKDRITSIWSQNSLVGVLLEPAGKVEIVHSRVFGTLAHDGFNWTVIGTVFEREKDLSDFSKHFDNLANQFVENATQEEKIALFDELFDALLSGGYSTLTELTKMSLPETVKFLHSINTSKKVHQFIRQMIKAIGKESVSLIPVFGPKTVEAADESEQKRIGEGK